MANTLAIQSLPHATSMRLAVFPFAIVCLGMGFLGIYQCFERLFNTLNGIPNEGSWVVAISITVIVLVFGAGCLRVFLLPDRSLTFDPTSRTATLVNRYPFGVEKQATFDFAMLTPPSVVWQNDSDLSNEGYWQLRLTLPNGTTIDQSDLRMDLREQKDFAQSLCDQITKLIQRK